MVINLNLYRCKKNNVNQAYQLSAKYAMAGDMKLCRVWSKIYNKLRKEVKNAK